MIDIDMENLREWYASFLVINDRYLSNVQLNAVESFLNFIEEHQTSSDCNGEYELENAKISDDSPPHNSGGKTQ